MSQAIAIFARDHTTRPRMVATRRQRAPAPRLDGILVITVAALITMGLVAVYSSSSVYAASRYGDAEHFLKLQLAWCGVGLAAMAMALRVSSAALKHRAGWIFLAAAALLVLVLVPAVGHRVGGARRWLSLFGATLQPSELAKLAVVVILAAILSRRDELAATLRPSLMWPVLVAQLPVALILAEPDLGTALVLELIVAAMVFAAGLRLRTLIIGSLAALPIFYHLVVGTPFRLQRLLSFIDPWAYRSTIGYQVTEALISIGAGGVTGVGLGESKHKLLFLPEAHTDFIFAILAEELGLVGAGFLLVAFALLAWRGVRAATRAATSFDAYLAVGLVALIGVPAVFNVCVATGLLPTKGLPLPFVSYGGSDLLANLMAVGLLLRIERDGHSDSFESAT
ncbi:MAG: putative lipid II flippase FtsW [Deltaproteobacteria bacterium]|nr:putative lipid II flippase FtsW [Deltaproteobacteria bacterium]